MGNFKFLVEGNNYPVVSFSPDYCSTAFYEAIKAFNRGEFEDSGEKFELSIECDERDFYSNGLFLYHSGRIAESIIWFIRGIVENELICKIILKEDFIQGNPSRCEFEYANEYCNISRSFWDEKVIALLRHIYNYEISRSHIEMIQELNEKLSLLLTNYNKDEHEKVAAEYVEDIGIIYDYMDIQFALEILKEMNNDQQD